MQYYKLTLAYDGTTYHGWQDQPNVITVAGILHKRFQQTFQKQSTLIGASRTDAGVHALGQVAHLVTDLSIDTASLQRILNQQVPSNILIRSIESVPEQFHAQKNVQSKMYYYHIFPQRPLPFIAPFGWHYRPHFDVEKLKDALNLFVGTHDFRSYCTGYEKECTVRTINNINVSYIPRYQCYRIMVQGPGFLRYMIRRLVGAALTVASNDLSISTLTDILEEKNPHQRLLTAPAHGLLLRKIIYKPYTCK